MTRVRTFAAFWLDFLVGDDWRLGVGLLLALTSTVLLHRAGLPAWWLLPVSVLLLLAASLRRATRARDEVTVDDPRGGTSCGPGLRLDLTDGASEALTSAGAGRDRAAD
jgi:hypothetical protein